MTVSSENVDVNSFFRPTFSIDHMLHNYPISEAVYFTRTGTYFDLASLFVYLCFASRVYIFTYYIYIFYTRCKKNA